jgi:uncharacterized phage protein (TIGR01671 family)
MAREIKFRYWMPEEPHVYDAHMQYNLGEDWVGRVFTGKEPDIIPLQFTGLLDRNSKEIYEGDIIQQHPPNGDSYVTQNNDPMPLRKIVAWCDNESRFELRNTANEGRQSGYTFCPNNSERIFEVIGNIYENPELLK